MTDTDLITMCLSCDKKCVSTKTHIRRYKPCKAYIEVINQQNEIDRLKAELKTAHEANETLNDINRDLNAELKKKDDYIKKHLFITVKGDGKVTSGHMADYEVRVHMVEDAPDTQDIKDPPLGDKETERVLAYEKSIDTQDKPSKEA